MAISLHRWSAFYKYLTETLYECSDSKKENRAITSVGTDGCKITSKAKISMYLQDSLDLLCLKKISKYVDFSFWGKNCTFFSYFSPLWHVLLYLKYKILSDYKLSYFLPFSFHSGLDSEKKVQFRKAKINIFGIFSPKEWL